MTNEELIEELYHKAHVKGFFHELHDKVNELSIKNKFKCRHGWFEQLMMNLKNQSLLNQPRNLNPYIRK